MNGVPSFAFSGYVLTRVAFERGLALVYLIAFLVALNQFRPLLGEKGLLPVAAYLRQVPFRDSPSLFYLFPKDAAFASVAWIGILISCFALLGFSERYGTWLSILIWTMLWALYMSFVNVGQISTPSAGNRFCSKPDFLPSFSARPTSPFRKSLFGCCDGFYSGSCSEPV